MRQLFVTQAPNCDLDPGGRPGGREKLYLKAPIECQQPRRSQGKAIAAGQLPRTLMQAFSTGDFVAGIEGFAMPATSVSSQSASSSSASRARPREDFIDASEVAAILGISKPTLLSDRCRAPQKVPPCYRVPGRRGLLWLRHEVIAWVQRFPESRNAFLEGRSALVREPRRPRSRPRLNRTVDRPESLDRVFRSDSPLGPQPSTT